MPYTTGCNQVYYVYDTDQTATSATNCVVYQAQYAQYCNYPTTGNITYTIPYTQTAGNAYCNIYYNQYQGQYQVANQWNTYNSPAYVETPADRRQREAREAEYKAKQDAATKRAEELLLACLSDEQAKQYLEVGYFETSVNDKTYRIKKGTSGNVELIEKGIAKFRYCAHPSEYIPHQDTMLAQLLMLQTDEDRFLKTANRTIL